MSKVAVNAPCPCGSGDKYKRCCQRFHRGGWPDDALQLMKSRYSAYAVGDADYVMRTTHLECPEYNPDSVGWRASIAQFCRTTDFVGLSILGFANAPRRATVTFRAHLRQAGVDVSFSEISEFVRESGHWLYRAGTRL